MLLSYFPSRLNIDKMIFVKKVLFFLSFLFVFFFSLEVPRTQAISIVNELTKYKSDVISAQSQGQANLNDWVTNDSNGIGGWIFYSIIPDKQLSASLPGHTSAMEGISNGIAFFYGNQPASMRTYVADLARSAGFGFAEPAYAQGLGFASLDPILTGWKIFRNLAYSLYVIIFLGIGFMIMFRQKIGGQTAVTVQQALPSVIISLIAVTFSYAIAGLLIDAMYLSMYLIIGLFGASKHINFNINFFQLAPDLIWGGANRLTDGGGAAGSAADITKTYIQSVIGGDTLGLATVGGLAVGVVVAIAILIKMFQIFIELLKTYVTIILTIALAPLTLMVGAIPGQNAFAGWIKVLIANLAVFPLVLILLIIFDQITNLPSQGAGGFVAPYVGFPGATGDLFKFIVGIGAIFLMTDLITEMKKKLGGGASIFDQFGNSFMTSLGAGWKGGELIPGLGFTNLANYGISGQNAAQKGVIGLGTGAGALVGGTLGLGKSIVAPLWGGTGDPFKGARRGGLRSGQYLSDWMKDPRLFTKLREKRKSGNRKYGDSS